MKQKIDDLGVEVQGIEMIDMGNAAAETKQGGLVPVISDSCCSYTYIG